jgi:ABC-type glutathione transport system ATPase component
MNTILQVENLSVAFRHDGIETKVVDGIDFSVGENEIVGLVGESGSGKTVTALSLMGLLPGKDCRRRGSVRFDGRDISRLDEAGMLAIRGSKMAMVFQEPFTSLNPVLCIGEQIDETIRAHRGVSKDAARARTMELLKRVMMGDPGRIYDSYPHLLSGGERQRVMIAMAIALEPALLIADEPTTALDVTIQAEILELITKLKNELRMAVLFITHDFGIINALAQRVMVMKDGAIVEKGTRDTVLKSPENEYTKRLIAAVPRMAVHKGTDRREGGKEGKKVVSLANVNKSFPVEGGILKSERGRVRALRDVTLTVNEGRTLGLVGESGSGKTTLGKLLVGLLEADSGQITRHVLRYSMQIVFQDPYGSLDPCMKMQEVVLEGPTIRGMAADRKDRILRDVLFKVHLNYKDRGKYPHQFSGGQRQRIAIARSLAVSPSVLVLDEPVSSLDVITQSEILRLLKELQRELGLTYVFISHDMRVVEYMADEVAVLRDGEIVESASRDALYASPHHPYTKKLLSCVPTLP